ncbi:MAG: hypothetical protein DSZ00_01400 [Gammaproteobacteria bacterium]|nr:MAG: hypothetical protein DSZ00_01400 [Gammaproteobacteria bacterium]
MALRLKIRFMLLSAVLLGWCGPGIAGEDILTLKKGAMILSHMGQYGDEFPANALIDGQVIPFWSSARRNVPGFRPDSFIIELARPYRIRRLVVENRENDEMYYPGISARKVRFSVSTVSSTGPWKPAAVIEGKKYDRSEVELAEPVEARWLKVEVLSNHGHPLYTEISELEAYGEPLTDEPLPKGNPGGIYRTNYGLLMLKAEGEKVEGCYELDKGYVRGVTNGRVFEIEWFEHRGEERGTALLVLSSSGFLNGLWYEDGKMMGPWFGNRLPDRESIDCDPVTAAAGVGLSTGTLADR